MVVTPQIVAGWHQFLDKSEAVLEGRLLLPHWRFDRAEGVNLRRYVQNPPPFDLVLLLQGASLVPYLEKGNVAGDATAETALRLFEGGFMAYFLWFN